MAIEFPEILDYWYSERISKQWFAATPELDAEIREKYEALWRQAAVNQLDHWKAFAEGSLALCIILDQFPLNMFRGEAKSFSTEQQAVAIAKNAIKNKQDEEFAAEKVAFLYMPLMHSENLADQGLSVACFSKRGLQENLRFARHHREIVRTYGRFPHRNAILGRQSTPQELEYLNSAEAFTG